jgi:hypothetical protein
MAYRFRLQKKPAPSGRQVRTKHISPPYLDQGDTPRDRKTFHARSAQSHRPFTATVRRSRFNLAPLPDGLGRLERQRSQRWRACPHGVVSALEAEGIESIRTASLSSVPAQH